MSTTKKHVCFCQDCIAKERAFFAGKVLDDHEAHCRQCLTGLQCFAGREMQRRYHSLCEKAGL